MRFLLSEFTRYYESNFLFKSNDKKIQALCIVLKSNENISWATSIGNLENFKIGYGAM